MTRRQLELLGAFGHGLTGFGNSVGLAWNLFLGRRRMAAFHAGALAVNVVCFVVHIADAGGES